MIPVKKECINSRTIKIYQATTNKIMNTELFSQTSKRREITNMLLI